MPQSDGRSDSFDSDRQYLGTVYAKALLGATHKAGNSEAALAEFDALVADVFDALPQLEATFASPRISQGEKVQMLDRAFRGKMSLQLLQFLKVVVGHGRFDCLRAINRAAHQLWNEMRGCVEVEVRTADALHGELLNAVSQRLRAALGRDVDLKTKVDTKLIGGLVVRIGDTVYDGSVANQLQRMRNAALDKALQEIRDALDRFALAK